MRTALPLLLVALAAPAPLRAGGVELTGFTGYTFPFYSQTFRYDPGPATIPIPGVSVQQSGSFELTGSGGFVFGGALTFQPSERFGVELRLDNASIDIEARAPTYSVDLTLPPPTPPLSADLELTTGSGKVKPLTALSANLKLSTSGSTRFFLSGGVSYLPSLELEYSQTVGLGVVALNIASGNLEVGTIVMKATPVGEDTSAWGANAGLGVRIGLGPNVALALEGRGFLFAKRTFEWEPSLEGPLSAFEQILLDRVRENLDPIEFEPWWVQLTGGISIRF